MAVYGYHRTSTREQHLDRGIYEIRKFCDENKMDLVNIFTDQQTGKNFNRSRYTVLVEDVLRPGDILIITELDRLGRNKRETMKEIQRLRDMGVRLMVLELPTTLMDMSHMDNALAQMMLETINNMMLELYASMAEAEMEKKEKGSKKESRGKKTVENGRITGVRQQSGRMILTVRLKGWLQARSARQIFGGNWDLPMLPSTDIGKIILKKIPKFLNLENNVTVI